MEVDARRTADPGSAEAIRQLIEGHRPSDDREAAALARFAAELARLPHPCDEHADPVHVTASAVVVGTRGTVLHLHRRLGRWLQPGGHVDPGETPWEAALRETIEETGLPVTAPPGGPRLLHVDVHLAAFDHLHLDLRYLVLSPAVEPDPAPGESQEVRWYGWDEAQQTADESLAGALRLARAAWEAEGASWAATLEQSS